MKKIKCPAAAFLFLFIAGACSSLAGTKTWTAASGTNDWFVDANWNSGAGPAPVAGDDVTIASAGAFVLLTNSTPSLKSFALSNTLIFSNWNTTLSATNVTIQSGGVVTLPAAFTNNAMSNNVVIVCSNLTIAVGGLIDVNGCGYAGGALSGNGNGPGAGQGGGYASGAGHGGYGGQGNTFACGGLPYNLTNTPLGAGSGGGGTGSGGGGHGGGAVKIEATGGAVTVNGIIRADGGKGPGGGGSGGSIYITCRTFTGSNGLVSALGGNLNASSLDGSGGGGRIAVVYDTNAQKLVSSTVRFWTFPGGYPAYFKYWGDIGSLYFSDASFISPVITNISGQVHGVASLSLDRLTISNSWIRFSEEGFQLTVTNDVVVTGAAGRLDLGEEF